MPAGGLAGSKRYCPPDSRKARQVPSLQLPEPDAIPDRLADCPFPAAWNGLIG